MKKFYRVVLLFFLIIFLSTFNPKESDFQQKTKESFFEIKIIEVENNILTNSQEIINKLEKINKRNIFFIKEKDIAKPLENIDFLEKVEVKKKYPDTIIIKVFETSPVAIIFKKKTKYLLDSSSNLITYKDTYNSNKLPQVFGNGAENNFINFFNKLKKNNFPSEKIIKFYYFQIGRWDLEILDNKIIKFPYSNINEAIIKSIKLLEREDFKNYNVIDLRVDGKIIVE